MNGVLFGQAWDVRPSTMFRKSKDFNIVSANALKSKDVRSLKANILKRYGDSISDDDLNALCGSKVRSVRQHSSFANTADVHRLWGRKDGAVLTSRVPRRAY